MKGLKCLKSADWWDAALTRSIKTFFQVLVALVGTSTFIYEVDWRAVLSGSGMAMLLSLCTSLGGLPEVEAEE